MAGSYLNKYRIPSTRLSSWDYGSSGSYFVTICTKGRIPYFGEIENQNAPEMQGIASLRETEIGKIARSNWENITTIHPYVELDDFVVMPDHIHGILVINKTDKISWDFNKFGPQKHNLASIIRGYKSSVQTYATIHNIEFSWQPRYYDRVIKNEKEHCGITNYIRDNPNQWYLNKNNFENLFIP